MSGLVVFLLGTDHHRFDRLVSWADLVAASDPDMRVVVQHGATPAPRVAEGQDYMSHESLRALLAEASVVVCHGGPGTITDAREAGHLPICVPRDPSLGEHVDGHQLRFAAVAEGAGLVTTAFTPEDLRRAVGDALAAGGSGREQVRVTHRSPATDAARLRLAQELDRLMLPGPRSRRTPPVVDRVEAPPAP